MRLFVAIVPPAAAVCELDAATAPLRPAWPELRWTSISAWHVTLAFLGEVEYAVADRLARRFERAAGRHPSLTLSFAGAGAFPGDAKARVLWTGLQGDRDALSDLAASVQAAARREKVLPREKKTKTFRPHLTLARCRAPADVRPLVTELQSYAGAPWTAERIHLIRSHLGARPQYETVGSWPLRHQPSDDLGGTALPSRP
jgi:2'-5' RNA ligase